MKQLKGLISDSQKAIGLSRDKVSSTPKVRKHIQVYDGWSPEMMKLVRGLRLSHVISRQWAKHKDKPAIRLLVAQMKERGLGEIALPCDDEAVRWEGYMSEVKKFQKATKKALQGRQRQLMQNLMSSRCKQRNALLGAKKMKQFLKSVLDKDFTGDITSMEFENADGKLVLLTEPTEMATEVVKFFAEWMGRGQVKWFKPQEAPMHSLYRDDEEGRALRIRLADGLVTSEEMTEMGIPQRVHKVLHHLRRKMLQR